MTYQEQIEAVGNIARVVTEFDPTSIIAGGAPRDWYLKREARDIDFFIVPAGKRTLEWSYNLLEKMLDTKLTPVVGEGYEEDEGLVDFKEAQEEVEAIGLFGVALGRVKKPQRINPIMAVREAEINGLQCQFIMVKDAWGAFNEFPCSLSKFGISCRQVGFGADRIERRIDVDEGGALARGICYYTEGTKPAYLDKLKERYGFQFLPYKEGRQKLYLDPVANREKIILQSIKFEENV